MESEIKKMVFKNWQASQRTACEQRKKNPTNSRRGVAAPSFYVKMKLKKSPTRTALKTSILYASILIQILHLPAGQCRAGQWGPDINRDEAKNISADNLQPNARGGQQHKSQIPVANPNFEAAFQGECGTNHNSNPCEHICLDLHDGTYECSCFYGFALAVDGYSCASLQADSRVSAAATLPDGPAPSAAAASSGPIRTATASSPAESPPASQVMPSADNLPDSNAAGQRAGGHNRTFPHAGQSSAPAGGQKLPPSLPSSRQLAADNEIQQLGRRLRQTRTPLGGSRTILLQRQQPPNWSPPSEAQTETGRHHPRPHSHLHSHSHPHSHYHQQRHHHLHHHHHHNHRPHKGTTKQTVGGAETQSETQEELRLWPSDAHANPQRVQVAITKGVHEGNSDKWPRYELDMTSSPLEAELGREVMLRNWLNNQSIALQSRGREIEFNSAAAENYDGEENDVDPDIRSIMLGNDKLVSQLEFSLSGLAEQQERDFLARPEEIKYEHSASSRMGSQPLSITDKKKLDKLRELVHKTMGDLAAEWPIGEHLANEPSPLAVQLANSSQPQQQQSNADDDPSSEVTNSYLASKGTRSRRSRGGNRMVPPSSPPMENVSWHPVEIAQRDQPLTSGANRPTNSGGFDGLHDDGAHFSLCSSQNETDTNGGYKIGVDCGQLGAECESGGRCVPETRSSSQLSDGTQLGGRFRCACPVGRAGDQCQKPAQWIQVPRVSGHSYLALPMVAERALTSMRLVFKPELPSSGSMEDRKAMLLLKSRHFLLLIDNMGRVELRYSTGAGQLVTSGDSAGLSSKQVTRVIGSRDVVLNAWNRLLVTDASSEQPPDQLIGHDLYQDEGDNSEEADTYAGLRRSNASRYGRWMNSIVLVVPDKIKLIEDEQVRIGFRREWNLSNNEELFVAGLPDFQWKQTSQSSPVGGSILGERSVSGFEGCLAELRLNGRSYNFRSDLNGDLLDGFDVGECCR